MKKKRNKLKLKKRKYSLGEYCLFSYDFGRSTEETSTTSCNQPTKVREVALLLR